MKHMRSIFLLFVFAAALLASCAGTTGQSTQTTGVATLTTGTKVATATKAATTAGTTAATTSATKAATTAATKAATTAATKAATTAATKAATTAPTKAATTAPTKAATTQATTAGSGTPGAGAPQGLNDNTDPSRISNLLDFKVVLQGGEEVGNVTNLVLDFSKQQVEYLVVSSGGVLGIGAKILLIPWKAVQLPLVVGSTTTDTKDDKVITLVTAITKDAIDKAPTYDLKNLPKVCTTNTTWNNEFTTYWAGFTGAVVGAATQVSGTPTSGTPVAGTQTSGTTVAGTTTTPMASSTVTAGSTSTAGTGTGMTEMITKMGVVLAKDMLGYGFHIGTVTGLTTVNGTPAVGTGTPAASGTNTGTSVGTNNETMKATIDDGIIDVTTGKLLYIIIRTNLGQGDERLIPVPVNGVKMDCQNTAFVLNMSTTELQKAPMFENAKYPDTAMKGWDLKFNTFWADFVSKVK